MSMIDIQHLSYSSITLYLDCPEAWRRKYITKEPTGSSPALIFGTAFHTYVETCISDPAGSLDPLGRWQNAWEQALSKNAGYDWGMDSPEVHFNEGLRLLSSETVNTAVNRLQARRDETGPMVERFVSLAVPGVPVPVIGYIDFIAADGVPCDLKTSSRAWTEAKATDSLQGLFYLAALNQAGQNFHGWRFRHVVFVKTKEPKVQVLENLHKPSELFFLFKVVREVWRGIDQQVFPLNPGSWKCGPQYCDFYGNCRGKYG